MCRAVAVFCLSPSGKIQIFQAITEKQLSNMFLKACGELSCFPNTCYFGGENAFCILTTTKMGGNKVAPESLVSTCTSL